MYNLVIIETDRKTLIGTSIDVFWTKTFKKAISCATGKPLGWNQGNPQIVDNTAAICNIIPCTERTSSAPDKAPLLFYPFSNKAEYI